MNPPANATMFIIAVVVLFTFCTEGVAAVFHPLKCTRQKKPTSLALPLAFGSHQPTACSESGVDGVRPATCTSLSAATSSSTQTISTEASSPLGKPICIYHQVTIPTSQTGPPRQAISVEDLTPHLNALLVDSGMRSGVINVISRHTTTAITINERESRLAEDMAEYFLSLAPPDERSSAATAKEGTRYYHNDIDQRPDSPEEAQRCRDNGWDIDNEERLQAWRDQEPINAHSHLLSMLLGSSESIPVVERSMVIGQWQSVLLVDLDGPRERTVGVQLIGYQ
eukprot:CAMPEP_0178478388 /NCGR_PEP_ID=MMETSP0696-20121128/4633_1 /TAXON_ID=265572 /ORGANISM="Extubocellulus spinifer, Strain CCMP396" /LENGTH=281 /DNA_ID=CAMNT_0020105753 /DNA_START=41 /DNA_END=886 /DNA_ORIENTATION=+